MFVHAEGWRVMDQLMDAAVARQFERLPPHSVEAEMCLLASMMLDVTKDAVGQIVQIVDEESFFVQCDLDNNPAADRDLGRLLIEVGVAPSQPFEFVLLRVGRVTDSIEVRETVGSLGATGTGV